MKIRTNSNNSNKNRIFKKYQGIIKFACFAFLIWSLKPLTSASDADAETLNQKRSESAAYQVLQIYLDKKKNQAEPIGQMPTSHRGRLPASIEVQDQSTQLAGDIGKDPWGDPYHYRVLASLPESAKERVEVWSDHSHFRAILTVP